MKRILCVSSLICLITSYVFAAEFSPTLLKFSAPETIQYEFDGSTLEIPVTVSGQPASTIFLVYTKDQAGSISKIQNGHLGWHYVNKVDTCMYMSPPTQLSVGNNTIVWEGKDNDGNLVPAGEYTYYLWGYDNIGERYMACNWTMPGQNGQVLEKDENGNVLNNPVYVNGYLRWIFGSDPMDETLKETCSIPSPANWSGRNHYAIQPNDWSSIYLPMCNADAMTGALWKYKWVPNGEAELVSDWGENGAVTWAQPQFYHMNAVTDGNYVYITANTYKEDYAHDELWVVEYGEGSLEMEFDIAEFWCDSDDFENGGQMSGGPGTMSGRDHLLFLGCHCSCMRQVLDPMRGLENEDDLVVYVNNNGDYVMDHNFEEDAWRAWVCNDFNVGPYGYTFNADANYFSMSPAFDMGAVSFGLLAPDGTGIGYFAFSGETSNQKTGLVNCDNDSAFDGLYVSRNEAQKPDEGISTLDGTWYVAHDTIKGVITSQSLEISAFPDQVPVISGKRITVPVYIDMSNSTHQLGEYSAALYWPTSLLRFVEATGGTSSGWNDPLLNLTNTQQGELKCSAIKATGSAGKVHILDLTFDVLGSEGQTGTLQLALQSLSAAKTYTDLQPLTEITDFTFTIITLPTITVTAPNGGEVLKAGSPYTVTWSSSNVANVKIEYTDDGGAKWVTITASTGAAAGRYTWTVPASESSSCKVRISSTEDSGITDESNGTFTITPEGVWGDVNDNEKVNSADGLIIASYGIDIPVGDYENNVLSRGDVNADGDLDLADGLICARYGIQPDYPELPARVGQPMGTVAKFAVIPVMIANETAVPHISVINKDKNEVIVDTSVGSLKSNVNIGAASILIQWDPGAYSFEGFDEDYGNVVLNLDRIASGKIRISRIDVDGNVSLSFPNIKLKPLHSTETDPITVEVLEAVHAETFAKLKVTQSQIAVGYNRENIRSAVFNLEQNVPNPFNPSTTIHYTITEPAFVNLNIYNIQGQKIKTLVDRAETAGFHSVTWNGTDDSGLVVSSGVYIYQLVTPASKVQKQMLLVR